MTKAGLLGVVSFAVIFALLFTQAISFQQADFEGAYLLRQQHRSRYFIYYCTDQDRIAIPRLSSLLETKVRLIRRDLQSTSRESIIVEIYPDLQAFHNAIGRPDAPDWVVGYGGAGKIQIVSPLNPGPAHSFDTILNVAVHEMTHVITGRMVSHRLPTWLNEGIALYESQTAGNIDLAITSDVEENRFPILADLDIASILSQDVSTFVEKNGYEYAYTIVEFIIGEYGYEALTELLQNPQDFRAVFDLTEAEFHEKWIDFLKQAYSPLSRNN